MKQVLLDLELFVANRGIGPLLALLLLVASLGASAVTYAHLSSRERQLAEQLVALSLPDAGGQAQATLRTDRQRLAAFRGHLGQIEELQDYLGVLFRIASEHGVALDLGEYQLTDDNSRQFRRYQVVLPVKSSSEQLQKLCLDVLHRLPFAALESISFQRDSIGARSVEARIHFAFFLAPQTMHSARTEEGNPGRES